jgi:arylsulfatase A-like enzyme
MELYMKNTLLKHINRLMIFILGLTTISLVSFLSCTQNQAVYPNIIFLMTDDQRWDNFGCYGRPEFKTQHIDRLADQGIIFDNAFYAVSYCMPSRVTMMTGRYHSNHRVGFTNPNNYTLSKADFANSYPARLKEAGYRTGFIGKVGFSVTDEAQQPIMPKDYDLEKHNRAIFDFFVGDGTHTGGESKMWPADDPGLQEIYRKGRKNTRTLRNGEAVLRFLDTQPKDQPFCLSVSFLAVKHGGKGVIYGPHYDLFKDHEFSVPGNWVEGANDKLPKVVAENWRGPGLHAKLTSTPELYQEMVRRFAAQGYSVDQQVGLMMDKLKETGLLDNTIVIYTSDNGRFQGSHGLVDKCLLYEESVKAPLIVFDGRVPESRRGRRETAMISSVDIASTILSLAGLEPLESMQGLDFSNILKQTQNMSEWRDAVFMEDLFLSDLWRSRNDPNVGKINEELIAANKSYRCRGVRTQRWKYFVYYEHNPQIEELYDMEKDPLEQNNLVDQPEFSDILETLRKRTEEMYLDAVQ